MEVLFLLLPLSLLLVALMVGAFLWAIHSGQFEDLEGPAYRAVFDEEPDPPDQKETKGKP